LWHDNRHQWYQCNQDFHCVLVTTFDFNYDYSMWLFEFVVGEWIRWWHHNTNQLLSIAKIFSRRISQSACSTQTELNYYCISSLKLRHLLSYCDFILLTLWHDNRHQWYQCKQDFHCVLVTTFIIENNTATCTQKRWNHNNSIDVVILKTIYNNNLIRFEYCKLIGWSAWRKFWLCSITSVGIVMSPTYSFANDKFK
jgi:hypothetical protein